MDHGATTAGPEGNPNAALEDAKVFFLFPTCIWQHDLKPDDAAAIKATILPKIEQLLAPREETMRDRVWQTHHDLHKLEELSGLLGFVDLAVDGVLKFLQVNYKDIEVTGCWANVNPSGTDHHPHIHPNNFLSGVYYAQVPRGDDGLFLYDPRPQTSIIAPQVRKVTERLAKIGGSLGAATNHFNDTVKALSGRQGLRGKVERFAEMSSKVTRAIPEIEPLHNDLQSENLELLAVPLAAEDEQKEVEAEASET